jgi:hypothetical protein
VSKSAAAAPIALLALSGCQSLEVDQVATVDDWPFEADILCLGQPVTRSSGQAANLTYVGGQMRGGPPDDWPQHQSVSLTPLKLRRRSGRPTRATSRLPPSTAKFPLGRECVFPVERCVKAP